MDQFHPSCLELTWVFNVREKAICGNWFIKFTKKTLSEEIIKGGDMWEKIFLALAILGFLAGILQLLNLLNLVE